MNMSNVRTRKVHSPKVKYMNKGWDNSPTLDTSKVVFNDNPLLRKAIRAYRSFSTGWSIGDIDIANKCYDLAEGMLDFVYKQNECATYAMPYYVVFKRLHDPILGANATLATRPMKTFYKGMPNLVVKRILPEVTNEYVVGSQIYRYLTQNSFSTGMDILGEVRLPNSTSFGTLR